MGSSGGVRQTETVPLTLAGLSGWGHITRSSYVFQILGVFRSYLVLAVDSSARN